ncbi:MAG: 4'-phosphopantetheinyl transferase superfamily protein [Marinisporobacter sp.]|jgi:4'-phosphopantetheinyl transferase|nr:4'-phosphopantetheinyl transferase superfamily protein [Marinisporobacter sp.]
MKIYAVHSDRQLDRNDFEQLISWVTPIEQDKIKHYRRWQDAQNSIIGKIMIRSILCRRYQMNNYTIMFKKNDYGKPYILNKEDIHFNISHSGEWIVCAIDTKPIGIDVEQIKLMDIDIAKGLFSSEEYEALMAIEEQQRLGYFYDLWTLKESYIKADGRGLSISLDTFSCVSNEGQWDIISDKRYHCMQYDIDTGYKLSVCAYNNQFPKTIQLMNLEEFLVFIEGSK